jgi:poly(3-hydroxybutyrate) depolymerase
MKCISVQLIALVAITAAANGQEKSARRPGGANASFAVREFRGSNGQTLRYSLFVPIARGSEKPRAEAAVGALSARCWWPHGCS